MPERKGLNVSWKDYTKEELRPQEGLLRPKPKILDQKEDLIHKCQTQKRRPKEDLDLTKTFKTFKLME